MIATASPTVKIPFEDYQEVTKILLKDRRLKYDNQLIKSTVDCNKLNLQNLVLQLSGIKLSIPPFLYTRTLTQDRNHYKCLILIEQNEENTSSKDSIITEEDGPDYITSNGYILGAPLL